MYGRTVKRNACGICHKHRYHMHASMKYFNQMNMDTEATLFVGVVPKSSH